jgi:hypothetical protein
MSDSYGKVGFAFPASSNTIIKRRPGVELMATVGLAVSLVIAITAVSIGAAHARVLGAVAQSSDASLAVAALVALLMAGLGGLSGLRVMAARNPIAGRDRR